MSDEIDAIDAWIDKAWEAIKANLARKEWLRFQISTSVYVSGIEKSEYGPLTGKRCLECYYRSKPRTNPHCKKCDASGSGFSFDTLNASEGEL